MHNIKLGANTTLRATPLYIALKPDAVQGHQRPVKYDKCSRCGGHCTVISHIWICHGIGLFAHINIHTHIFMYMCLRH